MYRQITDKTMASPDDGRGSDEETELEMMQKTFLDRKKAVFERTKEADEELRRIREEEMAVQGKLQKIKTDRREVEEMRQALERLKIENIKLKESDKKKESLQAELSSMKEKVAVYEREHGGATDVNEMKTELETIGKQGVERNAALRKTLQQEKERALRQVASLERELSEKDALQKEVASLHAELISMKQKVAASEKEHGQVGDANEMKDELETLRQQNLEQSAALRKVKDAMQSVTSYSKTQQKEKEKLDREVAGLRDEIAALRLISEETQQRQLNEIEPSSSAKKPQQQQHSGTRTANELM